MPAGSAGAVTVETHGATIALGGGSGIAIMAVSIPGANNNE